MRGFMIEVTTDIKNIGFLSEEDLSDSIEALAVDFVANASQEVAERERKSFVEMVKAFGGETGFERIEPDDDGEVCEVPYVVITDDVKRNYFRSMLERLRKLAASISLDQFAGIDAGNYKLIEIKHAVQDDYGDMVYLENMYHYALDEFMRVVVDGTKCYIGNVVLLH